MHILEIPSFFPPYGGLFCLDQAKALLLQGHEVRILSNVQMGLTIGLKDYLCLPYNRFEHTVDGVTVIQSYQRGLPKVVRYNVERWVAIVRSMFRDYVEKYGRPDIMHAHCAKWAGYAAMLISDEYQIPYVITEHLSRMLLEEEFEKSPGHAWQIPLLKQAYERSGRVIHVSEELANDTACYYGMDYSWQYLSNTIDTDFFRYQLRQPLEGRPFRFCCIANYSFLKGYDVLFEAYRKLQDEAQDIQLLIAGQFTDARQCRHEIERLQLKGVKTYGKVDKQMVRDILYQSDALVLASRSEVQPLVLLEAMSTGIPVISTEVVPRSQRIKGTTIVSVGDADALADAMREVIGHSLPDGKALSEAVRQMASPEVIGRELTSVFSEVTNTRSSSLY